MKSVMALAIIAAVALFAFAFRGLWQGPETMDREPDTLNRVVRHPLSGVWLDEEAATPRVYGVMVENHFDSWPQSGLEEAALVIEAPVEARVPRMIAFFSEEQEVEKIGPVRSARPYYLDWNAEFDAVYAHVGGSPAALELLQVDDTINIDEFSNEWFFWRENKTRSAPHNVYTSIELLKSAFERFESRFGAQDNEWESWEFKEDAEARAVGGELVASAPSISIDFAGEPYVITWDYRGENNDYRRSQGGEPHEMENGALIDTNNVVVMETDVRILDSVGRRSVRTTGEGMALVFQDGGMIEATWKKPSRNKRLRFYHRDSGKEIAMNAGTTWIEVVPSLEGDVQVERLGE